MTDDNGCATDPDISEWKHDCINGHLTGEQVASSKREGIPQLDGMDDSDASESDEGDAAWAALVRRMEENSAKVKMATSST